MGRTGVPSPPMAQEIHYEIFRRHGSKGGWLLHDVTPARETALELAATLMAEDKATGVKVVKETYTPETGQYLSLKIYEDGHTKLRLNQAQEDLPAALPCFKPDDLYSYHARATMARVLHDHLARNRLTVIELIHRADALEKLEAAGTTYQHAIQKVAVAHASSTQAPVQQIIRSLNELSTRAIHQVYRDTKREYFPVVARGEFGRLADTLAGTGDGAYRLNAALARYLASANSWSEKLSRLLGVFAEMPEEGPGRTLLLGALDSLVAEILGSSAALHELMGQTSNLGRALLALIELFLGRVPADSEAAQPLSALRRLFAADALPDARTAIANRITAELRCVRRLCSASLVEELQLLRQIANTLVLGEGKYLSHDDLVAAFTLRSRRIIANESIAEHLAEAQHPDDKLERLLLIEDNIIGADNKRQLAAFVLPILTGAPFEAHFRATSSPVLSRLKRLAELQARVRRSGFPDKQREELAEHLDRVAFGVENQSGLLRSIVEKASSPVERAVTILKLCASGVFSEGKLSAKARAIVLAQLGRPGFFTAYVAQRAKTSGPQDAESAMCALMQMLEQAGITPETGLKSIAA